MTTTQQQKDDALDAELRRAFLVAMACCEEQALEDACGPRPADQIAPPFDQIAPRDLVVDGPMFKAGPWMPSGGGQFTEYCQCFELADGRWEGFVAVRGMVTAKHDDTAGRGT